MWCAHSVGSGTVLQFWEPLLGVGIPVLDSEIETTSKSPTTIQSESDEPAASSASNVSAPEQVTKGSIDEDDGRKCSVTEGRKHRFAVLVARELERMQSMKHQPKGSRRTISGTLQRK